MRLIDADALKANVPNTNVDIFENCRNCTTLCDWQVKELIDNAPTIDAVEVVHGEWEERYIEDANPLFRRRFYCSRCGNWTTYGKTLYCPNCGARMDGKEKDDEQKLD